MKRFSAARGNRQLRLLVEHAGERMSNCERNGVQMMCRCERRSGADVEKFSRFICWAQFMKLCYFRNANESALRLFSSFRRKKKKIVMMQIHKNSGR